MNPYQHKLDEMLNHTFIDMSKVASNKIKLSFTYPTKSFLCSLCDYVQYYFSNEPIVLELESPIVTVGDLHGNYLDLIRILQVCGHPSQTKYLFLGDIVDRGEFSFETILLIFLMKICYPTNIYLIRGNHEFGCLCSKYGFGNELYNEYQDHIVFNYICRAFNYIPLTAVVDKVIFCVHGGIGPDVPNIDTIKSIQRPIENFTAKITSSLIWSDPNSDVTNFEPSPRGIGYLFGQDNLLDFLEASKAVRIVRGHQFVPEGYVSLFDDRVITVFSSSNYCGTMNNEAAVLCMQPDGNDEIKRFPPLPFLKRCCVKFRKEVDINPAFTVRPSSSTGSVFLRRNPSNGLLKSQIANSISQKRINSLKQKRAKLNQSSSLSSEKLANDHPFCFC
ncbi:hypothetical protein M9Y10_041098 [Tritrichomonas musculus]|uniref:Serine/threonine-protein phosphatase n=1 Tax=Tritrichomonas musculus TaxID=1915356 RepID=A0ABR2K3Y9_9EUKA